MTQFFISVGCMIAGGVFAFLLFALVDNAKDKNEKDSPFAASTIFAANKLQRHTLSVAILEDRYVDDPVGTVERVKKEFANELYKIVEDNIESENDRYSNHIKFYVDIWTKEAADNETQ